jgi:MtrB/PioB family decaheme-associated outer membrane protein
LLAALACAVHAALAGAQELPPPPDTSAWKCEDCPADAGTTGYVDVGVLGANGTNDQFGTYSGLKSDDAYLQVGGAVRYRGTDAEYFDLDASRFNFDGQRIAALAPYLSAEGGKQGLIEFTGSYEEIPYYPFSGGFTPYLGAGGDRQTLPSNWVTAGSTAGMTALPGSLHETGLRKKRQIADLGGVFLLNQSHWSFDLNYRHDKQDGEKVSGANFLTTTSLLAAPISYSTDQVDAGAQYSRDNWQFRLGYYGSFFHNADAAITWDNPFTPFGTANVGRMSVAPDNSFNQFSLSGGWQIVPSTRLMGNFSFGEASQNDTYIPSTINPGLTTQPLPRSNLDGSIDTYNYMVRLTSRPIDRLSITADYVDDRRDNKTAQAPYSQVVTDVFVASTLFNLPYSFDRTTGRVLADIAVASAAKVELGIKGEHYDTTYQTVAKTSTSEGWLEIHTTTSSKYGFSFKYDRSRRTIDEFRTAPTIIAVENPLLRRFDLADRTRDELLATGYLVPVQSVSLGLSVERHKDEYDKSEVGLTGARDFSLTLSGTWTPAEDKSLQLYATRQVISADQANAQNGGPADWFAHTADEVNTGGLSGEIKNIKSNLNVGANVYASYTRESINVDVGLPGLPGFPNNTFRDVGLRLFANYRLNAKSSLRFDYWHERYRTQDWSLDGVAPATIVNALTLGIASPNFTVDQLSVSYRYEF